MNRGLRCLAVWAGVTMVVALGLAVVWADVVASFHGSWAGLPFDVVLVRGTAVVAALAAAWVWLVTTVTALEVGLGRTDASRSGGPVRRLVLAACGVALLAGAVTAPAGATPGLPDRGEGVSSSVRARLLAGLPLPDRASISVSPAPAAPAGAHRAIRATVHRVSVGESSVVVVPGDSLWSIAAATLPPGAHPAQVDRRWRQVWAANRDAIGPDPDLVVPGLRLVLPPS